MILLDTSAAIYLLRGEMPPTTLTEESIGISTIVGMELQTGAFHGGGQREKRRLKTFLEAVEIFNFDRAAALQAAKIRAEMWHAGQPIGDYDTLIAGHALTLNMPLLTANAKHFNRVKTLDVLPWST